MLTLFGRPQLTAPSGERIDILPTGWRLLAALAAGPAEGVPRAELAGLVVPSGKLGTLRKLVWDVRRSLGAAGLALIDGDASRLRLAADAACDVRELRAARPGRAFRDIYRGAFFEGAPAFDHAPWAAWLAEQREALRQLYVARAGEALARADRDWPAQVGEARHLLRHAPDHAEATRILMLQGARAGDGREIRVRFDAFGEALAAHGAQPDRSTANFLHRLLGDAQRRLGGERPADVMALPTVYVAAPTAAAPSRAARMVRSLLTDLTIGLCRASLFRVVASQREHPAAAVPPAGESAARAYYVVASTIVDHVVGDQIVFTLMSVPDREILWTERVEAAGRRPPGHRRCNVWTREKPRSPLRASGADRVVARDQRSCGVEACVLRICAASTSTLALES